MRWVLLDIALCIAALVVLAAVVLGLWRRVKALGALVSRSSDMIGTASEQLARARTADHSRPDPADVGRTGGGS